VPDVVIRQLRAEEAPRAFEVGYTALHEASQRYGMDMQPIDDVARERGRQRLLHVLRHDAETALVAECDGDLVGVTLATRRGPLWFLSLLAVSTVVQSQGIGQRLLDAAMATLGPAGAICASDDPKAIRRYRLAGFDLTPCYRAKGVLDRSLLPAAPGVRPGSYDSDRSLIEEIATLQRGAPHGADLDLYAAADRPLFVADTPAGRGYVVVVESGPGLLAATSPAVAQALLWTSLAEASAEEAGFMWATPAQAWAIDAALTVRLSVTPSGTFATRGRVGPMTPYLPNGAFG
ncbi:MAG: hypothetical protein QOI42_1036, partial [Frankiaceae bacterium]|nr:hypothetical protein [Frankiaceae bacterium]